MLPSEVSSPPEGQPSSPLFPFLDSVNRQWSSELRSTAHVDLQATAMAGNLGGTVAVLAGRKSIGLISLTSPSAENPSLDRCYRLNRTVGQKWEISCLKFNRSVGGDNNKVGVSSNKRTELLEVTQTDLKKICELQSHTRYVTDIDWHPHSPSMLASCSIDGLIYLHDPRVHSAAHKASQILETVAAVQKIQWNPHEPDTLLSSHESDLRLWDVRHSKHPLKYATAHTNGARILSLDWDPSQPGKLVTAGQDCTAHFWDVLPSSSKDRDWLLLRQTLKTSVPIWRARHTPFGEGLATVVLPHLQNNDHSLFLWNTKHLSFPVHCFYGHKDVILDFEWRRQEKDRDYQMLTWSKDQTLRLWRIDGHIQGQCGADVGGVDEEELLEEDMGLTRSSSSADEKQMDDLETEADNQGQRSSPEDSSSRSISNRTSTNEDTLTVVEGLQLLHDSQELGVVEEEADQNIDVKDKAMLSLKQEMESLSLKCELYVKVESADWEQRSLRVSASFPDRGTISKIYLVMSFPNDYPSPNSPPGVVLGKGTSISRSNRSKLIKSVRQTGRQLSRKRQPCIRACLQRVEALIEGIMLEEQVLLQHQQQPGKDSQEKAQEKPFPMEGSKPRKRLSRGDSIFLDSKVPFPRRSGVRFSKGTADYLACFFAPPNASQYFIKTPRALSAYEVQKQLELQNLIAASQSSFQRLQATRRHYQIKSAAYEGEERSPKSMSPDPSVNETLKRKGRFRICSVRRSSGSKEDLRMEAKKKERRKVLVYNSAGIHPYHKFFALANSGQSKRELCQTFQSLCLENKLKDLAHIWSFCLKVVMLQEAQSKSLSQTPMLVDLRKHPMGRPAIKSLIQKLVNSANFQLASLVIAVFHAEPLEMSIYECHHVELPSPIHPMPLHFVTPPSPEKSQVKYLPQQNTRFYQQGRPTIQTLDTLRELASKEQLPSAAEKKSGKFWFMKPGALPDSMFMTSSDSSGGDSSPYHTIHAGVTSSSSKANSPIREDKGTHLTRSGSQKLKNKPPVKKQKGPTQLPTKGSDTNLEQFVTPYYRAYRSNSWSDPTADLSLGLSADSPALSEEAKEEEIASLSEEPETLPRKPVIPQDILCLLDPLDRQKHDEILLAYANMLHAWDMMHERCAIMKLVRRKGLHIREEKLQYNICGKKGQVPPVINDKKGRSSLVCVLCSRQVRGASVFCDICGHGGHFKCMRSWINVMGPLCSVPGCKCKCM